MGRYLKSQMLRIAGVLALSFSGSTLAAADAASPWMNASLPAGERASLLEARMTEAQELLLVRSFIALPIASEDRRLPAGSLGSAGFIPGIEALGIPALQESDGSLGIANPMNVRPGDRATALPAGLALASTFDEQLAYEAGAVIGREAWHKGFNVVLAGGINLARDPRGGRNFEFLGEDPHLAGTLAAAEIRGIQAQHVISTVKHFVLNDQETHRQQLNAMIAEGAMRESDLLAFELAVEGGHPGSVMCSYNLINGDHGCGDRHLLHDILKRDWAYPGFVMSDWGAVHSVRDALAGLDQESGEQADHEVYFGQPLQAALASGAIPRARLDDMVQRILRSMFAAGLFDYPPRPSQIDYRADGMIAQAIAASGIVLLKNADETLPLRTDIRRLAVIGGHADLGVLSGGGSSQVLPWSADGRYPTYRITSGTVTGPFGPPSAVLDPDAPLAAIRDREPGAIVRYGSGRDPAAAERLARWANVVIVFATRWQTEAYDSPDLSLSGGQDELIAAVAAANPRTVVVLETGDPVAMPWLSKTAAVIEAWYPGQRGGQAIADILSGRTDPSGHLPVTFPRSLSQEPRPELPGMRGSHSGQIVDVDYNIEGAAIGYRWFAAEGLRPLFPFGFGLSYTHYRYTGLEVRADGGCRLTISFDVRNSGRRAGAAVPQIYMMSQVGRKLERLLGFSRTFLPAGHVAHVRMTVDPRLLATFDAATNHWRVDAGTYSLALSASAADPVATTAVRLARCTLPP